MPASLMKWGVVAFEVYPLNVGEIDHTTGTDWARKEIAGAPFYREWVGEGDEEIHLRGKVFPHFMMNAMGRTIVSDASTAKTLGQRGGLGHLDIMDNMRRQGQAHLLIRGDGWLLGWYVIDRFSRGHSFLGSQGVGQQVAFEATFQRVPVPDAEEYFSDIRTLYQ